MKRINFISILIFVLFFTACDPTIDNPIGTGKLGSLGSENQNFKYVAIGTSFSAGATDQAIFALGQQYCIPKLIAEQIGIANFVQANYNDPGTGVRIYLRGFNASGLPITEKAIITSGTSNSAYAFPYSNLSLYGAVIYDLIDTSDFAQRALKYGNPHYMSVLRSSQFGKSIIEQVIAQNPNLITIEMGLTDVMMYASSGGTKSTYGMPDNPVPTPKELFLQIYHSSLQSLVHTLPNAKIILFTVPNFLGTAFFNTVPWNALVLSDTNTVKQLNSAYSALGFKFKIGQNGFVAESPRTTGGIRQLTSYDYITLQIPQDSLKVGWGTSKPIPSIYVLDSIEAATAVTAINDYNAVINGLKSISTNIYVYDFNQSFSDMLKYGYAVPGSSTMTAKYISGGMFGLDGLHPTLKGYGAITNEFLKYLNTNFGSDIPLVNIPILPSVSIIK